MVGIRTYLLVVLGLLSVLPTVILGTIETSRASTSERERADQEGTTRATEVAHELDTFLATQTTRIERLASDVEAVRDTDIPALLAHQLAHASALTMVYVADRAGTSLFVDPAIDANGRPNAGTSYRDRDYYKELIATGKTVISGVEIGKRSHLPNVHIAAPIRRDGELAGYVLGSVNLDEVSHAAAHASTNGRVVVLDANHRVLADSSGALAVLTDAAQIGVFTGAARDERDNRVHVVQVPAPGSGWRVYVIRDQASIDALADSARRDALLIMFVTLAVALALVAMGVQWLARPIRALAATTKLIGGGDLSAPVPLRRRFEIHEIGELLGSVRDMARDIQRSEEAARMNDRLVAIGTLASSVAHEINNPLTYVVGNLWLVRESIDASSASLAPEVYEELVRSLDETLLGVDRVTQIVKDMKRLSRPDKSAHTPVDLNALLDSCVRMAAMEMRDRATVECAYGDIPRVVNNEARLSQVFLNLLINAAQACEASEGRHSIRVTTALAGDRVKISIADTGKGIDPEVLPRIFDPFFTTKQAGVGTGLGLSVCMNIVKQSGGTIEVDSVVGRGTTFRVILPVGSVVAPAVVRPAAPRSQRVRILVVDDEAPIRTMLARSLAHHDLVIAASAEEAFARATAEHFDVLLSDVSMPGEDGFSLHRRLEAVRPELARSTVFITGGSIDPADAARLEDRGIPCVFKPFKIADLEAAITRVLTLSTSGSYRSPGAAA